MKAEIIRWLMEGDPAIRYQTLRDLTVADEKEIAEERNKISVSGWGNLLLAKQDKCGTWGDGLYSPKWISTTYTLLLLRDLGIQLNPQIETACRILLDRGFYDDGGINFFQSYDYSETCVSGMVLSILAYFKIADERLEKLAAHLLSKQMADGGWNCLLEKGATHGSFHTTMIVLEGLREYEKYSPKQAPFLPESQDRGVQFLLEHRLFRSHRTGEIIDPRMLRFAFPCRWYYDIMRALDYASERNLDRDRRFLDAIGVIEKKRRKDKRWNLQNRHPGKTFFEMEQTGLPSRWITLRALRILCWFRGEKKIPIGKL